MITFPVQQYPKAVDELVALLLVSYHHCFLNEKPSKKKEIIFKLIIVSLFMLFILI